MLWQDRHFNGLKENVLEFIRDLVLLEMWVIQEKVMTFSQCLKSTENTHYTSECPESTQSQARSSKGFVYSVNLKSFTAHEKQYKRAEFMRIVFHRAVIETFTKDCWKSDLPVYLQTYFYFREDIDWLCKTGITNRMLIVKWNSSPKDDGKKWKTTQIRIHLHLQSCNFGMCYHF